MAIVERKISNRSGAAAPLDGIYYPKPSYADEPYFQEINGSMHFLIQPWMKTVCFDSGVYDWDSNLSLLQDVYIAPPKDTAAGWNIGDEIVFKFMADFYDVGGCDLIYFGFEDEDVYFDTTTVGGDNQQIVDGQFEAEWGYALFEYYPLLTDNFYNVFTFKKIAQNSVGAEAQSARISPVQLTSMVLANAGQDVYDIVYPY